MIRPAAAAEQLQGRQPVEQLPVPVREVDRVTVVAIAHRLHTAHDADRIAVVIDGRIVELGAHDELVALGGEYADLWRAWTS